MKRNGKKPASPAAHGGVSAALVELLTRQVADRGIVVWYDPQRVYGDVAKRLAIPDCTVLRLEQGFFRLREQLEPLVEFVQSDGSLKPDADIPPRLVIYVPMARDTTQYALVETEAAGSVVEPDAAAPERNTRFGRIVETVFATVAPAKASHLARQADDGLLTVEELDRMAGEAGAPTAGALQIVYGPVSAEEMLLQFVANTDRDADILAKSALSEILSLIRTELGLELIGTTDCQEVRDALVRLLLFGDLLAGMSQESWPPQLSSMKNPRSGSQQDMLRRICRQWRNRTDLQDAYAEAADRLEQDMGLPRMTWPVDGLSDCEAFSFAETLLLQDAVQRFLTGDSATAAARAAARVGGFWPNARPVLQLAWRVVESGGALAQTSGRVKAMLHQRKWPLDEFIDAYASHADPWMRLDRLARDLEFRHARWEAAVAEPDVFETLMARARQLYLSAAGDLVEAYAHALRQADFHTARHAAHAGLFELHVKPALQAEGKVACFLVDALRYEMAAELIEGLKAEFETTISPVLGCLPGITPVGMAALMPGTQDGLLLAPSSDRLEVRIGDAPVSTRTQRLEWLEANAGVPVCCAKLADALKPAFRRRKDFVSAKLVVITSQEIDLLGEEGDEEGVRLYLVDVLEKLRRAMRVLAKAGVSRFVVAADHGFLYAPGVDPGLTMDAPGGKTVELHPRVWIGEGGASGAGFFRVKATDLGLRGSLELAFPVGLGSFRTKGGGSAYSHGGVSPAENILPAICLTPISAAGAPGDATVRLTMSKPAITNRLFSVSVDMKGEGLFVEESRRVEFQVLSGQKDAGRAAAAAYGFEDSTGEVILRSGQPNVVTFMLNADAGELLTIKVLDCQSQLVLDALKDIPVKLGM